MCRIPAWLALKGLWTWVDDAVSNVSMPVLEEALSAPTLLDPEGPA